MGCKESDMTEQLSTHICTHVHMHTCMQVCLGHHGDGQAARAGVTTVDWASQWMLTRVHCGVQVRHGETVQLKSQTKA